MIFLQNQPAFLEKTCQSPARISLLQQPSLYPAMPQNRLETVMAPCSRKLKFPSIRVQRAKRPSYTNTCTANHTFLPSSQRKIVSSTRWGNETQRWLRPLKRSVPLLFKKPNAFTFLISSALMVQAIIIPSPSYSTVSVFSKLCFSPESLLLQALLFSRVPAPSDPAVFYGSSASTSVNMFPPSSTLVCSYP